MRKHTILLVDDDPFILTGIGQNLESESYEVTTAENGEMALELLEKSVYDLVITDLIQTRYFKLSTVLFNNEHIPHNTLTTEEDLLYTSISSTMGEIKNLTRQVLKGQIPKLKGITRTGGSKILLVRFLTDMPAIVGSNMNTYGPFKAEDVASLPVENAESLIRRGVASKIET